LNCKIYLLDFWRALWFLYFGGRDTMVHNHMRPRLRVKWGFVNFCKIFLILNVKFIFPKLYINFTCILHRRVHSRAKPLRHVNPYMQLFSSCLTFVHHSPNSHNMAPFSSCLPPGGLSDRWLDILIFNFVKGGTWGVDLKNFGRGQMRERVLSEVEAREAPRASRVYSYFLRYI
jgi:hypothetical protein